MKLTKEQLRQIIKEELGKILSEDEESPRNKFNNALRAWEKKYKADHGVDEAPEELYQKKVKELEKKYNFDGGSS
jgi:hypothetical protein